MPVMITLNKIREASLSDDSWEKVLKAHVHLGMDTEFPLSSVLDSNDLEDTLWCFEVLPEHIEIPKRFAIWCACEIQHLMTDEHSVNALNVAERYLDGNATLEELKAAYATAAYVAAYAAAAAIYTDVAAYAAAAAIYTDVAVAARAARDARAYAAVRAALADLAALAADRADRAADRADRAAGADMKQKQINKLKEMLNAA